VIDTHCHIDLYPDPLSVARETERLGIITISMTNLPSHFEMGYPHLQSFKKVRLALGMHPLHAEAHLSEFNRFRRNLSKTSYVGEIGLDFSREGYRTKDIQIESFKNILAEVSGKKKLLSLHSRRAEKEVLKELIFYNIHSAIFHWYSGPTSLVKDIAAHGFYFSINSAMIKSSNGQKIISAIPKEKILTETDGPFIENNGRSVRPSDIGLVHDYLSNFWGMSKNEVEAIIRANFATLIISIK
jgi:TatD DNase family protein